MNQNLINHIYLMIDKSGSMHYHPVVKVVDLAMDKLKQRSQELDQETRISIYLFNDKIEVPVFDMDVMRFKTMDRFWQPSGQTALRDAVGKAVDDASMIPQLYGDHAHLMYIVTDGEENASRNVSNAGLTERLNNLPNNWTVACLVPNSMGRFEAKKFGIPDECVAIWDTSSAKGFEAMGEQMTQVYGDYMKARATGVRGSKSLFRLEIGGLKTDKLTPLTAGSFETAYVSLDCRIDWFVTVRLNSKFQIGKGYYQLTKKVKVQDHKNIIVRNNKTKRFFSGSDIRELLGLPDYTVEVDPNIQADWTIFIQSTSSNRKLIGGTEFVYMR